MLLQTFIVIFAVGTTLCIIIHAQVIVYGDNNGCLEPGVKDVYLGSSKEEEFWMM
jgi:hypothetical protein